MVKTRLLDTCILEITFLCINRLERFRISVWIRSQHKGYMPNISVSLSGLPESPFQDPGGRQLSFS